MPSIHLAGAMADIDKAAWDTCMGTDNPFVRHAFLEALERSGSAVPETGWHPRHMVATEDDGKVVACAPMYLKTHSYGEYVFDWGWAEAYTRAGGRYYPKLQCAVPFTPVAGPRLGLHPEAPAGLADALPAAMIEATRVLGASSVHVTFLGDISAEPFERNGFVRRLGHQYHWHNQGYDSFDHFLAALSSRKRKQIRKERAAMAASGLTLRTLVGDDVKARHWDAFHRFHQVVVDRKWGSAYLTRDFFDMLSASELGGQVVLIWAEDDGEPVAAAFNMLGGDTLYGRTWGAGRDVPFLHFEACYYRALDFAIVHGLARVEAGAQGEHKVARGYEPVATHSVHWLADQGLHQAVARAVAAERLSVAAHMMAVLDDGPFRQNVRGGLDQCQETVKKNVV
ncbi:GNAT family N-acetyltransferase [Magnetospirillum aberrantis]|uniref:N-acetyltransferase n=1 Tax=Magnetospirillum aberrantis SpK TaxID=908842 RepID=A0A7C9QTY4_9PROT|nr:GNAT family N-acetyltransferase [Magnetospirillum aberrantis]NFV80465.1 N-acetyltransferase [Magnetospirillum aberrantis SpK]